jgi:hypothetical protein
MSPTPSQRQPETIRLPRPLHLRWQDLVALRRHEVALNLGLSAPWLAASLWAAS